jgi:hypothetical protein
MDDRKTTGSTLDWDTEDQYWRSNYSSRPYAGSSGRYEDWQPAYRYGFESANRHQGRPWEDVEHDLRSGWESYEHRGGSRSTWEQVKDAVRDGWNRLTGNR